MENSAPEAPTRPRNLAADFFSPDALKGPGVLALAAAGHVALIANAQPQTLPALWEMATLNPLLAVALAAVVGVASFLISRLSEQRILLVRRATIALIAGCLSLIAIDLLNFINADQQPWSALIGGATVLVLIGGLATLIADVGALSAR